MAAKEPRAEVHALGNIHGFPIYDVFYRFRSEGAIDWKSILVRAGPGRYREIYHDQPTEGTPKPSFVVKAGEETILSVQDNRYRMDVIEDYWCFTPGGPVRINLTPVWDAARRLIPADQFFMEQIDGRTSFPNLLISVPALAEQPGGHCCDVRGGVIINFKMQGCSVVVTGAEFNPGPDTPDRRPAQPGR